MADPENKDPVEKEPVKKELVKKVVKASIIVKVKNKGKKIIHVSKGIIGPGKTGGCTAAELRSYSKYLEKA